MTVTCLDPSVGQRWGGGKKGLLKNKTLLNSKCLFNLFTMPQEYTGSESKGVTIIEYSHKQC